MGESGDITVDAGRDLAADAGAALRAFCFDRCSSFLLVG